MLHKQNQWKLHFPYTNALWFQFRKIVDNEIIKEILFAHKLQ